MTDQGGFEDRQIVVDLYDGAESLIVERSQYGNYCDFRVVRQDLSTLLFVGGYAQLLRMNFYQNECARLSIGDAHVGLMTVAEGQAVARFLGIEPRVIEG